MTDELQAVYDALAQAQDCIRGETPEDISDEEAREDTINKVRDAMRAVEAMQSRPIAQGSVGPGPIERMVTDAMETARLEAIEECVQIADSETDSWIKGDATTAVGQAFQRACRQVALKIRALAVPSAERGTP